MTDQALVPTAPVVTSDHLALVKTTIAKDATDAELKLYLYDCARQGIHPLDRLLHFTKRGGKYTPVTSIDLMRIRAAETGEYAGSDDAVFDQTQGSRPDAAHVTVWRLVQGQRCAFSATARWAEYYPGDSSGSMWRKMPYTMLAKCAEALALRKGFPRQLSGLYASEELDQADRDAPVALPTTTTTERRPESTMADDADAAPGDKFLRGHVTAVEERTGTTKGKAWTVYLVTVAGHKAGTFDSGLALEARSAFEAGEEVDAHLTPGRKAGTWELANLERVIEPTDRHLFEDGGSSDPF